MAKNKPSDTPAQYDDLKAVFINCTLKPSPQPSHTDRLMDVSRAIMEKNKIQVRSIRLVDHAVAPGVYSDMREHGAERDAWPELWPVISEAEIVVVGTPIWLGMHSSQCALLIERLYGHSGELNDRGQYAYYGKTGGCIVTGNEDGVKHVGMSVLYALQHIGFTVPPQADAGWIGEAGPGPSYGDETPDGAHAGLDNDFTQRNTTFATWNLIHFARMLKDQGGVPAHGNQRSKWEAGCRFDHPNPDYR